MRKLTLYLTVILGAIQLHAQNCPAILSLTTPETSSPVTHQASGVIVASASYGVSPGYNSTLRAGTLIEIKNGSLIKSGSLFLAKIGACTARRDMQDNEGITDKAAVTNGFKVYPNPVESLLNISADNLEMTKITLTTLDGRLVATYNANKQTSFDLEFGSYSSGIYFITVETDSGKIFREKVIKN
jgi:hypothetical protein